MRILIIAALAAAQLSAAASPARADERKGEDPVAQRHDASAGARLREEVELNLGDRQATESRIGGASASPLAAAAAQQEEEPRKKRKSTGDKVLTGAAVILGVGALAVGGLLIAIFVG